MHGFGPPPRMYRPTDGLEKPKSLKEIPSYLFKRAKGFLVRLFYIIGLVWQTAPAILVFMALFCLADGLLPVAGAYISSELLNEIAVLIGESGTDSILDNIFVVMRPLILLFALYFIYLFVKKILTHVNTMVTGIAGELVSNHIKMKILAKSKTVDLRSFDRPEFYEKLENANREASMRPIGILSATFRVISSLISVVSFIVVLATLSPVAPLIIIIASVPGAIVNYVFRNRNFRYIRRHSKDRRQMQYYSSLMVNKDMAKEIKLLGLGDTLTAKYKSVFRKYYKGLKSLIIREGITQTVVGLVTVTANCALFLYVAYTVVFGNGRIGDYSLYTGALTSIAGHVATLVASTATIYEGTLFINNMMEFMNEEPTVVPTITPPRIPERGCAHTVEFKNVSFSYPGTDRCVIKNVNLTLRPSESVVLVGLNGAGKTTLIKLLTRLYDPTEGVILLDGHDIREYDVDALYDMYGIVFQDFGKYAESAAENIEFGDVRRDHDREDVKAAAKRGNSADFIERLPLGYDTPLTRIFEEDGIELSVGQWQKLSISRAFYKSSDILILDEPTASLDPMAEQEVFDRFAELTRDKISIFVSHRLSSATTAGKIVVLENGQIVEEGTHEELMSLGGKYHKLFTTQAQRYTESFSSEQRDGIVHPSRTKGTDEMHFN
ncbi:MAG: ABC transporter ATP-binding protein [Clostridia bacterium]|nr:ABC transporter ATP-binding protein [Clostridia bacterium]